MSAIAASTHGVPMQFQSTRGRAATVGFAEALAQGLAPDGGLYLPLEWPHLAPEGVTPGASAAAGAAPGDPGERAQDGLLSAAGLAALAERLLAPFAAGSALEAPLGALCREAFSFPAPLAALQPQGALSVLELFHGPTAAFKDFGARFLAACLTRLRAGQTRPLTILVATSGDTGGAVAAAFHGRPGIEIAVLFPKGLVSPTQERQLTCWGGNVRSFAVRGRFDDCQRLTKEAFLDAALRAHRELSSANSINIGRLLPQAVYYAAASLTLWQRHGARPCFIIPSGNLGNAFACVMARELGMPIGDIVLAHNANRTVPEYLASGEWRPRPSLATLASAMDVGNPSNMERLRALYPQIQALRGALEAHSVSDDAIRARIRADFARYGQIWCPHTATAAEVYERLSHERRARAPWVLVATAHPAKFPEIVEPLIGKTVPVPPALASLLARPSACSELEPSIEALRAALA
ncbi:MAG TPA: threonine synthase [Steroidobacteraceae bacterium]|nr:threonine synthase [Steroidobacteraceae bacterium]